MNVFVYGTLQPRETMKGFTGRELVCCPAVLKDFKCGLLDHGAFPGIKPVEGAVTPGRVYFGLVESDFHALDMYEGEGSLYHRKTVKVSPINKAGGAGSSEVEAEVYVLSERLWDTITDKPFPEVED